jgi:hypothetical protein
MQAAIKTERGTIEMVQDRPKDGGGQTVRRAKPEPQRQVGFFEALFGARTQQPPARIPTSARTQPQTRVR